MYAILPEALKSLNITSESFFDSFASCFQRLQGSFVLEDAATFRTVEYSGHGALI